MRRSNNYALLLGEWPKHIKNILRRLRKSLRMFIDYRQREFQVEEICMMCTIPFKLIDASGVFFSKLYEWLRKCRIILLIEAIEQSLIHTLFRSS